MEGVDIFIYDDVVGRLSLKVEGSCMALYAGLTWEGF